MENPEEVTEEAPIIDVKISAHTIRSNPSVNSNGEAAIVSNSVHSIISKPVSAVPSNDVISNESSVEIERPIATELGLIQLSFPENQYPSFEGQTVFPVSYYTVSPKERLLLLFAENFRRQFGEHYKHRRPLVLAVENECQVQKFVSTTIRPSSFLFPEMIGCWEECASFVADYITYEPLLKPTGLPDRLISPDTLLKRRLGNSFEMATLLCSLLIGNNFPAYVVNGYAKREVTINDQRRVKCPIDPDPKDNDENAKNEKIKKYTFREPSDFRSKFLIHVEEKAIEKERQKELKKLADKQKEIDLLEELPPDKYEGRRVHAWVVVILKIPAAIKIESEDEEEKIPEPEVFFIEPSTGAKVDVNDPSYFGVECVWNHQNYYVNRQDPVTNIPAMKWVLSNTQHWEHLLPAEPFESRIERPLSAEVDKLTEEEEALKEKHLDMPVSWVDYFHVGLPNYEERFPNGEKTIHYKYTTYERFAPYKNKDGLTRRLTYYETLHYEVPLMRWEWYQNREDMLQSIKIDFREKQIDEKFYKGRPDFLKFHSHKTDVMLERQLDFFHVPRFDSLKSIHMTSAIIKETYEKRDDLLYYREYHVQSAFTDLMFTDTDTEPKQLTKIVEKFYRNKAKLANEDVAQRIFNIEENKISIKFHYDTDSITASTREFYRPPDPDYGQEIPFNPALTSSYTANPIGQNATNLDLYLQLLEQLKMEENAKVAFKVRIDELHELLSLRNCEMKTPKLTFSIFDPLRNEAPRRIRLEKYEQMRAREERLRVEPADFLAAYIIGFPKDRKPTKEESVAAFNNCLDDLKHNYLTLLNELQRRYDEASNESRGMRRFLEKFQDQFNDFDYENLMVEGEAVNRNKRVIQYRIIDLHEEAQRKYLDLKTKLLSDPRLNFDN